ncbi:hypothetical protein GF345_04390, partial [Candidatus Woesearchaeota archaeon]|nr:hypothetical protein [Candidatus Woesearchaeota archaeon]
MENRDNANNPEHEEEQPSLMKRILLFVIGLFILFLFLSYFLLGPYTLNIIGSMLLSSELEGYSVEGDGFNIVFTEAAYTALKQTYLDNQDREFKACLKGNISGDTYIITDILLPDQRGSYSQVVYTQCPSDTIVSMHSHPYRHCRASERDFESFEKFRQANPDAVMMVMCEAERFYVYR